MEDRDINHSWVKLYRKIADNEILHDANCLKLFIWLLTRVDKKTGVTILGRFSAAQELRMNPSTFRDTVYRLRDKYKAIDTKTDNKKTEISLRRWDFYNPYSDKTTPPPTTRRQPDDTIQDNKTYRHNTVETEIAKKVLLVWNKKHNTKLKSTVGFEKNLAFWLTQYEPDEIYQAIININEYDDWMSDPTVLFRKKNPRGEDVDYIGKFLSRFNNIAQNKELHAKIEQQKEEEKLHPKKTPAQIWREQKEKNGLSTSD